MRTRFIALALAFALTACASVEDALPPTVQIANVRLASAGLLSQELLIDLRVGNPNDFTLPLRGLTFELDVNGRHFASGLGYAAVDLPRLGYATVPVKGTTDMLGIIGQILALGETDRLSYRIHGRAYIGGLGRNQAVPYERSGELSLFPTGRRDAPGTPRTLRPI
jgi:LEA14-like dessication related protein